MQKRTLIISLFFLSTLLLGGCYTMTGSGNVIRETRDVSDFQKVSISGGGDLILEQGGNESVEIEAEDNIIEYIETEVHNGTLYIGFSEDRPVFFSTTRSIRYYVTMKDIEGIKVSGGGDVEAKEIESKELDLEISGGGDIEIRDLSAERVNIVVSGGGDIEIAGKVPVQYVEVSGGGDLDTSDLESEVVKLHVSGGGEAFVWATEELDIDVSGGGDVRYYGHPRLTESISGGGDVISKGDHR
jgi:predicted small secreted protein